MSQAEGRQHPKVGACHKLPILDTKPKEFGGLWGESTPPESSTESSQSTRHVSIWIYQRRWKFHLQKKRQSQDARGSPEEVSMSSPASCGKDPDSGPCG